jgi:hypothetical protein
MATMPRSRSDQSWWATGPALLLAAAVLASCSSGTGAAGNPTTSAQVSRGAAPTSATTRPSTTDARSAAEAAVLAAYRGYWADVVAVGKTADWESPRLAEHATGQALAEARATFHTLKTRGQVARGTVDLRPTVLSVSGRSATLYDCNSTSQFLAYDAKTGALRDKSSGRRNGKTVTLTLQGSAWKVANVVTEVGTCARR